MSAEDNQEKKSDSLFAESGNFIPLDFRWPKKGDCLLRAEGGSPQNVTFEERGVTRHLFMWDGYMKAGAVLIDNCEHGDNLGRHTLVYSILFCYRHGLELALKWIIGRYGRIAAIVPANHMHHNLLELWKVCKTVILELGSDGENDALQAVEKLVKEFHDLDHGSFSFRYSTDKKGMVIYLPNESIDLFNIKDVMEGVTNFFDGVDAQLDYNASADSNW